MANDHLLADRLAQVIDDLPQCRACMFLILLRPENGEERVLRQKPSCSAR
jgi:hypothetical protein